MTVNINGKEIALKYTFRAMMLYENITNKSFEPKGISEFIILFYSMVMAADKDCEMSFNDFMDWLDENQSKLNEFTTWLASTIERNNYLSKKEDSENDSEKKS